MTRGEFIQFSKLSLKLEDHVRATEVRADWFKQQFYNSLKEKRQSKARIAELELEKITKATKYMDLEAVCFKQQERIAELVEELSSVVAGLFSEQEIREIKADAVRNAINYIEANFQYGTNGVDTLLNEYANKIERGEL